MDARKYKVKVRPFTTNVSTERDVKAGLYFGSDANGRYVLSMQAIKVDDGQGGEKLVRRLQLHRVTAGAPETWELLAESAQLDYDPAAGELTLVVEIVGDLVIALVEEDDELEATIAHAVTQATGGDLGLEVAGGDSQTEIASEFDEFRWLEVTADVRTWSYTYDNMNRLVDVLNPDTTHDGYDYNVLGQLATRTTAAGTTNYSYDRHGRLVELAGGGAAAQYRYYGPTWMRRTAVTGGGRTDYVYDGFACVQQKTGGVTTNYGVPGSAPLWETTGGDVLGYAVDGTGNVTGLYGELPGGQAGYAAKFFYDAWGNLKTEVPDGEGGWTDSPNTSGPRYRGDRSGVSAQSVL